MKKKELRRINPHQDYVLSSMTHNCRSQINVLVAYMQDTTPYGDAYKKAFEQQKKVFKEYDKLVDLLQDCVEERINEESK